VRDRIVGPEDDGWARGLAAAHLPDRYQDATIEAIKAPRLRKWLTQATEGAAEWMAEGFGYYLHGPFNGGKSSIAAILLMEAVRRCERALWLPVRAVPGVRFREGERNAALDDYLAACDFLVLDDLGAERFRLDAAGGAALESTARIMYDRRRPVVLTANVSWRTFPSAYADAGAFVSCLTRVVSPVEVVNDQWPVAPTTPGGIP
jgi:DNA replication protein DnaC